MVHTIIGTVKFFIAGKRYEFIATDRQNQDAFGYILAVKPGLGFRRQGSARHLPSEVEIAAMPMP
ncbi:MAG: hypothetical protein P0Y64_00685 [Candidatus Sphingomonas colombiensis]|nr:hypothetical protein [Sphingomonas sp.]WEK43401.1 MAG: hypothetical protein P0Y64_00685 [Sphingomonas sp.]